MFRRVALAVALVASTSVSVAAQSAYSGVFFFGTSELDAGNWLLNPTLSSNALAPTADKGYWNGRWQSGPGWSDYLAQALGFSATPSLAGGNNYAYGVGWMGPLDGEAAPTPGTLRANPALWFGSQVDAALTANSNTLASDALYVVSIGFNDVGFWGRAVSEADDVANLALEEIQRLVDAGATNFLVQTLGGTDEYVTTYNATLLNGLAAINGIDVSVLDTRIFNQTIIQPQLEGLGITYSPFTPGPYPNCLADPACRAAAIAATTAGEQYLDSPYFNFDNVHRDPKVAEALANYAITQLPPAMVPEPDMVWLLAVGIAGLGWWRRRRRDRHPRAA